jgi:hypothetical protein
MLQTYSKSLNFQASIYPKIASELSGQIGNFDNWQKGQAYHVKLLDQSYEIADKLESVGISSYVDQDLTLFGLHSRSYKKLPNFRNINFIPYVARKNRNKQSKELELFLQRNPNARMFTLTSGTRTDLDGLAHRVKWLHRKISRSNCCRFMKEAGARFVFRATEFGELAENGSNDLSVHPHCHAVLVLEKKLTRTNWSKFLKRIHAHFGTYLQDNGKIKNARELVKYCVKPSDLDDLNARQLKKLYESSKGLRLCEALRDFRKLRGQIRTDKMKVIRRKDFLTLVPSWNGTSHDQDVLPESKTDEIVHDDPSVLAWCVPSRVFTPVTEPIFLVHGLGRRTDEQIRKVFEWTEVVQMQSAIKVHTEVLTDRQDLSIKTKTKPQIYENESSVRKESTFT